MKTHRFIGKFRREGERIFIEDEEIEHQIKNVLKLAIGERIILSDGKGREVETEIREIVPDIIFEIIFDIIHVNETSRRVVLFAAILKRDNFELLAQKATDVGVS